MHRETLRLILGLFAIAVGAAAFAWPSATVQVVGFLFGLNLVVTGFIRAALLFFVPDYPLIYRVVGIVFGVLTGIVGILCLRNVAGSVILLLVVIAIGWLLDGLVELFTAIGTPAAHGSGWRIGSGLLMILGAIAVLVWPRLGLATFVAVGATVLVFVGIVQVLGAIAGLRAARRETIPAG
ncbi:DUF308 domain-containing protein [Couchioplanes caeruleus]|uniref:Acid-resistance membrane protein n=2 Tax=Couchioplanes caeruleus TaxID=56438 RepID=A0A1K0FU32_9ACTN|nr:DUF308 domain-containing protein [Couchioplanes caeruleus]OJF16200.1 hypothetical protein BG844_00160 [Couchioplanes caeruleus subsp. caeruleus]ROP28747.1 uncharacterized membrane protein HdeD (DUF308 family) [Couchioplanes caeruleus]